MCPSVRLRPLSIPLWHIPVIKKEVCNANLRICGILTSDDNAIEAD